MICFILKANYNNEIPIYYLDCAKYTFVYGKYNYFHTKNFQPPIWTSECEFQGIIPVSAHKLSSYNTGFMYVDNFMFIDKCCFFSLLFYFAETRELFRYYFFPPPPSFPQLRTAYLVNQFDAVGFWYNRTNKWNIIQNLGEILMLLSNP